ncbi:RNA-binding cell elongation regulator Jag/EloR [Sporolactobacillus pectinivorans]|uniref:RNA-binding cell elongation regulator Jag/EloR n=1 Tax=Sporolactobacillus pectinivorans TaxID=1591408 RepID=UPI000C25C2F9|nr:RNA-binding cell elongation regulator Jag/EloR [Sporolactobacillus pectinivorans]
MREVVKYGKTVAEAVSFALEELNATEEQVKTEILVKPRFGFLGIGSRKALVRVKLNQTAFDEGISFLKDVVNVLGLSVHVQVKDKTKRFCHCVFSGRDAAHLIGKHGETLNALQFLANSVVARHSDSRMRLFVDAENYREIRKKALIRLAERIAAQVVATGKTYRFKPMPFFERKLIHVDLAKNDQVRTRSFGEEPYRCVAVVPRNIER